jgi:hypothetical protein
VSYLTADGVEQQWPPGDGLMMIGVGETDKQVPPIEHPLNAAGHRLEQTLDAFGQAQFEQVGWQRCSASRMTGSMPKPTSPRIGDGCCSAAKPSSNSHRRGEQCLKVCWLPGTTSTTSPAEDRPSCNSDHYAAAAPACADCSSHSPLLVAVERLHRRIDIENPKAR